ncbi:MAG: AMP-binding protein, partial [Bosea sp. (in: a-proteobacteria)]
MTAAPSLILPTIRTRMPGLNKPFIETPDGVVLSYGALLARSAQLAHVLVAGGVKPGDRVAVQVEKSVNALVLYLACIRAG